MHLPVHFRFITHLYLSNSASPSYQLLTTENLPNLTHLVYGMSTLISPGHLITLLGLLAQTGLKKLRILGLQIMVYPMFGDTLRYNEQLVSVLRDSSFRDNKKIVIIPAARNFTSSHWKEWFQGGEDIWNSAERLLSDVSGSNAWGIQLNSRAGL